MSDENDEGRECPYCGAILHHPYWSHVQQEHPAEYAKNETWVTLYNDYSSMGMDESVCLMVIGELFNVSAEEVKSFIAKQGKN